MKKFILSFTAALSVAFVSAQGLPNGSFENGTDSTIDNWTRISGKAYTTPSFSVPTSQGTYTVNPSVGTKLGVVANDTTGAPQGQVFVGRMQSRFAYNKRPARLYADILYATAINSETFAISVVMFRNNGGTNDTVLNRYIFLSQAGSLLPNPVNNVIPWLSFTSQLAPTDYIGTNNPDSCVITVLASGAWTPGNQGSTSIITTLLLDNMRFSPELTSVRDGITSANHKALSNYPNPASGSTTISFDLPLKSNVELNIFDINGRQVYTENLGQKEGGSHAIVFNTSSLDNGVYFYNIKTDFGTESSKMVIVR